MTPEKFQASYFPHRKKMFYIAYALLKNREDAEDVVQEAFALLWKQKEQLDGVMNSEAYSVQITKNLAIDLFRSHQRKGIAQELDDRIPNNLPSVEDLLEEQAQLEVVTQCLQGFSPKQRKIFSLRHQKGLGLAEIAKTSGESLSNVKVILSRIRQQLKEKLNR